MRRDLLVVELAVSLSLVAVASRAAPLRVVEVEVPDLHCVFRSDCLTTVTDFLDEFAVPAARGEATLQSRSHPPGEEGTPGAGLHRYEYRVDLTEVGAVTASVCVRSLEVDFGPIVPLDYDGDGRRDQVFVITEGSRPSDRPSRLAGADQTGSVVTFSFSPSVCPGSRPGGGESSFFFGLASEQPPSEVSVTAALTTGEELALEARAPAGAPPQPPPDRSQLCQTVPAERGHPEFVPIPRTTPVCRCLEDPLLRLETQCAFLSPDLFVVWRYLPSLAPGEPFVIESVLWPATQAATAARIAVRPPPGFAPVAGGQPPGPVARHWLVAGKTGRHTGILGVTLPGTRAGAAPPAFELRFPLVVGKGPADRRVD